MLSRSVQQNGLHNSADQRAACGLGFVAKIDGAPSREIVEAGLSVLDNLDHRGATGADPTTGDGAGILTQIPHPFFARAVNDTAIGDLPAPGHYGVGMCFSWGDPDQGDRCEDLLHMIAAEEGQRVIGWRDVPVDMTAIGVIARRTAPRIRQVFIERDTRDVEAFERKLYLIRRRLHRTIERAFGLDRYYIASLSSRTIVYKGLLQGTQVAKFYPDLRDPQFMSALALVHSRFSTNTAESWGLAHPYRYVAHNGEINTVRGNLNWMRARLAQLESELFGNDIPKLRPIIEPQVSDSAALDNALEFLHLGGRSLPQAIMTMVPEAWESDHPLDASRRAFYQYSQALMQPWDGPAAIAFTDGRVVGAALDRNGLRPARYSVTKDGWVVLASEDGVYPLDPADIVERWRLGPGRMMVVDLERQELQYNDEVKSRVVATHPYRGWVFDNTVGLQGSRVDQIDIAPEEEEEPLSLLKRQKAFGYTYEDVNLILQPMAKNSQEPDGSMGSDTPLAVLSERPRLLFDYFHQLFAQVTNPPIDPLRERSVMSLRVSFGRLHNLLTDGPQHARRLVLPSPVLTDDLLKHMTSLEDESLQSATVSMLWDAAENSLEARIGELCKEAAEAVEAGASILVLSDRGIDETHASIPSLLATSAVHHHLVRSGLGGGAALVVDTGEAREVHHIAALIGFGAYAVCPYVALQTVAELAEKGFLAEIDPVNAKRHFVKAINKGLLKVISKMGISTIHSYTGSQLFEILGLGRDVVDQCFTGAVSRIGGLGYDDIARERLVIHRRAFDGSQLESAGEYQLRRGGVPHQWNEHSIPVLQRAVRTNDFETYEDFARSMDEGSVWTLRSLFELHASADCMPLDEVESASEIVKRFNTGAMSLGSVSREVHESFGIAMNHLGGRSNSGEGGEDLSRSMPDEDGSLRRSSIKQVASGRFGVTTAYVSDADVLQIKVAQGAKPGEGGQLPGHKVSEEIARLRYSTPGVGLISPPPHHDIYSIEDLKQLIFDLKMVNPTAQVSVKLVAEAGVGTVATGVAKAKADHITISGFEGGTGAAVLSSIKHAGLPWELGLAEAHQALVQNGLRGRVTLQVDGQLKTGRDVVIGALLGGEEFAFSTAPLVAMGCVMMRVCHLNTCPVGIATQDPLLRAKFRGQPEHVINYFFFVAEQVRKHMATMGFRRFDDMIGRADKLVQRAVGDGSHIAWKVDKLDLSPILQPVLVSTDGVEALRKSEQQDHGTEKSFDSRWLELVRSTLTFGSPLTITDEVHNTDRSVGAMISGEIVRSSGGLPDDSITLSLRGTAGLSLGAWGAKGLTIDVEGAANDYVGKGLSGAKLIVRPPADAGYEPGSSVIVGNVALYGATSGEAYFGGVAGERFAVRNSGATAVVEGCGDHGCEYMTGGVVVVLGKTGRNFAAGMSGGFAYLYEPDGDFRTRGNLEMVSLAGLDEDDAELVRRLLMQQMKYTNSQRARMLLDSWPNAVDWFVKIVPHDVARMLEQQRQQLENDHLQEEVV